MKSSQDQSTLYALIARLNLLVFALIISACSTHHFDQSARYAEVKFPLQSANFETDAVHAVGEASCLYILLTIPVCKNQNIATIAWQNMRREAQMEGKSAQFINVFEDHSLRWNFFYIFYQEYYSVSANVIVYKQQSF